MRLEITEEWSIIQDASSWNLAFQSAEISKETGRRISTVETTYHGNLEQALVAFLRMAPTKKGLKVDKGVMSALVELKTEFEMANEAVHKMLINLKTEEKEQIAKLPRIIERRDDERGETRRSNRSRDPKRMGKTMEA